MKMEPRHRSGTEAEFAADLTKRGVRFRYESISLPFTVEHIYRPDFEIVDAGIIVEFKGFFSPEDRAKHVRVKAQHPDRDIRIVFENAHRRLTKSKRSKTYAQWCDQHGIKWAHRTAPDAWFVKCPKGHSRRSKSA